MAGKNQYQQEPVAITGFACRLPGHNNSPQKLWEFLERGGIAPNTVPESRFKIDSHYDGSHRPGTMRPSGGMFLEEIDLARFDASFFEVGGTEAIAMDPNQRQMLEVVYEGLENAGISLDSISGAPVACFVGSYASDYAEMQNRDAEDRPVNCAVGVGRSIMANRLSYFFNIHGPSVTIDTACSGSLVGLDMACRTIQSGEADAAIIATSNLYLHPDHVIDRGSVGQTHSATALCHTFDEDADGYVKSEAVSCVIIKRVTDAIKDRDPIRAIIRGTATNSNGRTTGIASPSSTAQAAAIRLAYRNAGLTSFNDTAYLECHGTGTQAGDPTEVSGVGSVFGDSRSTDKPLIIGSIKSNIGHSEPAAGNSGLIKVIMAMERGVIPGTPTFIKPNPTIDFVGNKLKAIRTAIPWPDQGFPIRRASINSFGYGGSNAHCIVEQADTNASSSFVSSYRSGEDETDVFNSQEEDTKRPYLCVVSANDATSLKSNIQALCRHLVNPRIKVSLPDLAYTLSERRKLFWHRAFITTRTTDIHEKDFTVGTHARQPPKIAMIFTGQGAQWPQMGKALVDAFPWTRLILEELDRVLQAQRDPPSWSLISELTEPRSPDHMRQPELSQTLVTALQLCIVAVFERWGVRPSSVVGHSSGEIAAAYAAGLLGRASAILAAFYRGRSTNNPEAERDVGMLALGLSAENASSFVEKHQGSAWIACYNSPYSVTVSGRLHALEVVRDEVKAAGHFARLLLVDCAYHSPLMLAIGKEYLQLLKADPAFQPCSGSSSVTMFSSVTATQIKGPADGIYWQGNMTSPVQYHEALRELILHENPSMLIEVGPSDALRGPTSQILQSLPRDRNPPYCSSWCRGANAAKSLFDSAGGLVVSGAPVDMFKINAYDAHTVRTIVDLPNYSWNHPVRYWHENAASKEWRFKKFITHELLGSKVPGTLWSAPVWRRHLHLADVPWLRDHRMGIDILMPGTGFVCLALEAMYQTHCALNDDAKASSANELAYRFRNISYERAMALGDNKPTTIVVTLARLHGSGDWHEFRIQSTTAETVSTHCYGLVQVQSPVGDEEALSTPELRPLRYPQEARLWYEAQSNAGMEFGPTFRKMQTVESINGSRKCRSLVDLQPPPSQWSPAPYYPLHPAVLDSCFGSAVPANAAGDLSAIKDIMIPAFVEEMVINKVPSDLHKGLSVAHSEYTGRGRRDVAKSWAAHVTVHDPENGALFARVRGLHYVKLDTHEQIDPHVFLTTSWKPDISLLTPDRLTHLLEGLEAPVDTVMDLIAHKLPNLKVLEISIDTDNSAICTLWFQGARDGARAACTQYDFISTNAQGNVALQEAYKAQRNAKFHLTTSIRNAFETVSISKRYDMIIIQGSSSIDLHTWEEVFRDVEPLASTSAFVLLVRQSGDFAAVDGEDEHETGTTTVDRSLIGMPNGTAHGRAMPSSGIALDGSTPQDCNKPGIDSSREQVSNSKHQPRLPSSSTFKPLANVISCNGNQCMQLLRKFDSLETTANNDKPVEIFRLAADARINALQAKLRAHGVHICTTPIEALEAGSSVDTSSIVLVLDALSASILATPTDTQWAALKRLLCSGKRVLWVTEGTQIARVTDPDNAMVHGLFRTIRQEMPGTKLMTLDLEQADSFPAITTIQRVLQMLTIDASVESEYAERDGDLFVPRLVPDTAVNSFKALETGKGLDPVVKGFHETDVQVRLQAESVGTLNSLIFCETDTERAPIEPEHVEVEVVAVGVNFKDVATTMGLVPEDELMIGCECVGHVKRLGAAVTKFNIGDRVAVMRHGTYANRVQCPVQRAHVIPAWMSFADAATIPLVYATALYGLYHLANLREGQTVLIHSAAGGVGLAAIQLAQHKRAEIFVTVSTNEKRDFLYKNFGIPEDHICNSRNSSFAREIRQRTDGRGVNVILNSLTGELLDESWRLLADGGILVEIGKRDIVQRNRLAMEPFDRNCTFRALDLSYVKDITDELIERLFEEIFRLLQDGHVKPIHPIRKFGFNEVIAALSHIRRGQHTGKIVVSHCGQNDVQLSIKPAMRRLRLLPNASYLIVGGLTGLCGSLAVYMARQGARHLIIMNRSGLSNDESFKVIEDCAAHSCAVKEARGDVGDLDFVRHTFVSSEGHPIAGVVQGAMTLRDKPFEMMTHAEYQAAIHAKTTGTWNLHNAAQEVVKQPLDFFTMLSSVAGVLGNKGQANYAAANTFLDAFASFRQSMGLRASSVDLGAIEEIGYIAKHAGAFEKRFDRGLWTPINEAMLRKIMSYSIFQQGSAPLNASSSAQLITGITYPLSVEASSFADDPRFAYLFHSHAPDLSAAGGVANGDGSIDHAVKAFHALLSAHADESNLAEAAISLLQTQIARLLRLEAEVEPAKPLMAYGLDSLAAVELRSWVRQNLGAELSTLDVVNASSLVALSKNLVSKLAGLQGN